MDKEESDLVVAASFTIKTITIVCPHAAKEGFRLCTWILLQKLQIFKGNHTLLPHCG